MIRTPVPNPSGSLGRRRRAWHHMWLKAQRSSKVRRHDRQQPSLHGHQFTAWYNHIPLCTMCPHAPRAPTNHIPMHHVPKWFVPTAHPTRIHSHSASPRVLFAPKSAKHIQEGWGYFSPMPHVPTHHIPMSMLPISAGTLHTPVVISVPKSA